MTHPNDTIEILLTQGKVAVINAADWQIVAPYSWVANQVDGRWYAVSRDGGGHTLMHRLIVGAASGLDVDHWDRDGLNNRRHNLREATRSQNMANVPIRAGNKSGYKGVSWHSGAKKWRATIKQNYRQVHLGFYADASDAARAYDAKAIELFGEFAHLNFPIVTQP